MTDGTEYCMCSMHSRTQLCYICMRYNESSMIDYNNLQPTLLLFSGFTHKLPIRCVNLPYYLTDIHTNACRIHIAAGTCNKHLRVYKCGYLSKSAHDIVTVIAMINYCKYNDIYIRYAKNLDILHLYMSLLCVSYNIDEVYCELEYFPHYNNCEMLEYLPPSIQCVLTNFYLPPSIQCVLTNFYLPPSIQCVLTNFIAEFLNKIIVELYYNNLPSKLRNANALDTTTYNMRNLPIMCIQKGNSKTVVIRQRLWQTCNVL
jgi:hypothetical protein